MARRQVKRFGSLRRLPSGRWQARYTWQGSTHKAPQTFGTEDDADKWLRTRRTELETGAHLLVNGGPSRAASLFRDYAPRWLDTRDLKPRTRVEYERMLERHLLPSFGRLALDAITRGTVDDWWGKFDAEKRTARAHAYSLLRSIMGSAVDDEREPVKANPCHVRGGGHVKRRHRIRPATPEQLTVIVEHMPEQLRAAVLIAAWGGLRWGEVGELRRADLEGPVVHVTRAVVRLPGTAPETLTGRRVPTFTVGTPKSDAGVRSVTLPPAIMPAIETHLDVMTDKGPRALLFPAFTDAGKHLAVSTLNRYWYAARAAAGRSDLRWHDLRHTGATFAAMAGATQAELMARLGHSTAAASQRYQHAAADRDARIADALSLMVTGGAGVES